MLRGGGSASFAPLWAGAAALVLRLGQLSMGGGVENPGAADQPRARRRWSEHSAPVVAG